KLFEEAQQMLKTIIREEWLDARAVFGLFEANAEGDDIVIRTPPPAPPRGGGEQTRIEHVYTADPKFYAHIKPLAKQMRKEMTAAERQIWEHVRNKQLGHKIRRQHIIGHYVVDFVCIREKLVIEID